MSGVSIRVIPRMIPTDLKTCIGFASFGSVLAIPTLVFLDLGEHILIYRISSADSWQNMRQV